MQRDARGTTRYDGRHSQSKVRSSNRRVETETESTATNKNCYMRNVFLAQDHVQTSGQTSSWNILHQHDPLTHADDDFLNSTQPSNKYQCLAFEAPDSFPHVLEASTSRICSRGTALRTFRFYMLKVNRRHYATCSCDPREK